jgi:hypothetical protein
MGKRLMSVATWGIDLATRTIATSSGLVGAFGPAPSSASTESVAATSQVAWHSSSKLAVSRPI